MNLTVKLIFTVCTRQTDQKFLWVTQKRQVECCTQVHAPAAQTTIRIHESTSPCASY